VKFAQHIENFTTGIRTGTLRVEDAPSLSSSPDLSPLPVIREGGRGEGEGGWDGKGNGMKTEYCKVVYEISSHY